MAQQSLYRRYRPRRFGEVRGQDHVTTALRNAVRGGTEGHAYLFSGPRGTGKTSTARILAKALNCEDLRDGEPCCECGPCVEMEAGRSFDLFELDAASNNGVDAIRELVERAAVGSPGRTKVYILDEVHMLTAGASNALLKTLEEPPEHVCFVLATTDPQKVLATIRSRTQHYEFQLLSAQELTDYVRWIDRDAGLGLDDASVAHAVRQGRGSARDTLSALDQVVAAGGVLERDAPIERLLGALGDHDSGAAVRAVSDAIALGNDPRVLTESLLSELRDAFLLSLDVEVAHLVDADRDRLGEWARALGTPLLTRSMEAFGSALVDMRQAADPRVPLEVALVRLCTPGGTAGSAPAGSAAVDAGVVANLIGRIEALERALAAGAAGSPRTPSESAAAPGPASRRGAEAEEAAPPSEAADAGTTPDVPSVPAETPASAGDGPARARAALGALRSRKGDATPGGQRPTVSTPSIPTVPPAAPRPETVPSAPSAPSAPESAAAPSPPAGEPAPAPSSGEVRSESARVPGPADPDAMARPGGGAPDRDALVLAFGDVIVPSLKGVAKAVFGAGRFVSVTDAGAVFALENAPTRNRAERFRPDVESALTAHFGTPVRLVLVDGSDPGDVPDGRGGTAAVTPAPMADEPRPPDPPRDPVSRAPAGGTVPRVPEPRPAREREPSSAETADDEHVDEHVDEDDDETSIVDVHDLEDADVAATGVEKLTRAFPGAVLVDGADGSS